MVEVGRVSGLSMMYMKATPLSGPVKYVLVRCLFVSLTELLLGCLRLLRMPRWDDVPILIGPSGRHSQFHWSRGRA